LFSILFNSFLLLGEFPSDLVRKNLVPIKLVAGNGKGTTKSFEGSVRELEIALVQSGLVIILCLIHFLDDACSNVLFPRKEGVHLVNKGNRTN